MSRGRFYRITGREGRTTSDLSFAPHCLRWSSAPSSRRGLRVLNATPYLLSDWSTSRRVLTASLASLHTAYGTAVWDSVILASRRLRSREGSAKAIVILTDGRADTTKTNVRSAIVAATRVLTEPPASRESLVRSSVSA
jgi:hypothetical protein